MTFARFPNTLPPAARFVLPINWMGFSGVPDRVRSNVSASDSGYVPVSMYTTSPAAKLLFASSHVSVAAGVAALSPRPSASCPVSLQYTSPSIDPSFT